MMKPLTRMLLLVYVLMITWAPIESSAQVVSGETQEKDSVVLKWLGTAGWEIKLGKTIILIDPFITRKDRSMDVEWKTDEEAVLKVIMGVTISGWRVRSTLPRRPRQWALKCPAGTLWGCCFMVPFSDHEDYRSTI